VRRRQRAERLRPSFALDGSKAIDHRRDFVEDRVEKRVTILLRATEQLLFHFVHRPRPETVC